MARYERIQHGEEKLDTLTKLKDFWQFGVEQGKSQTPLAKSHIAKMLLKVSALNEKSFAYKSVILQLEVCEVELELSDNDERTNQDVRNMSDQEWSLLEFLISKI